MPAAGRPGRRHLRLTLIALAACSGGELTAGEAAPASAVAVCEVEVGFSFARPPFVHPRIVLDFNTWWSDVGDQVVGINLLGAQDSNRYHGAIETRQNEGQCPTVLWRRPPEDGVSAGWFSYRYVGMTSAGVHVLVVQDAGGSSVFTELRLLALEASTGIEPQRGFDFDGGTANAARSALGRRHPPDEGADRGPQLGHDPAGRSLGGRSAGTGRGRVHWPGSGLVRRLGRQQQLERGSLADARCVSVGAVGLRCSLRRLQREAAGGTLVMEARGRVGLA